MKKLFLLLVGLFGFISFSFAYESFKSDGSWTSISSNQTFTLTSGQGICFHRNQSNITNCPIEGIQLNNTALLCFYNNSTSSEDITTNCSFNSRSIYYWRYSKELTVCPTCPTCDDPYTSLECQQEYNLIPLSSVDQSYCENNNLCLIYTGEVSTGLSTLYINDIWHQSAPFIYLNIPEEFNWDYSTGINEFTIDVEGYNVDTEYMNGVINVQNYKPTSEDFTKLVGLLAPYMKIIVFCLFVFFVWSMIKNTFKSKKL